MKQHVEWKNALRFVPDKGPTDCARRCMPRIFSFCRFKIPVDAVRGNCFRYGNVFIGDFTFVVRGAFATSSCIYTLFFSLRRHLEETVQKPTAWTKKIFLMKTRLAWSTASKT